MSALSAEQVREALDAAARARTTMPESNAILRRLLESGFIEAAMEYCEGIMDEEVVESVARLNEQIAAYRRLQGEPEEK